MSQTNRAMLFASFRSIAPLPIPTYIARTEQSLDSSDVACLTIPVQPILREFTVNQKTSIEADTLDVWNPLRSGSVMAGATDIQVEVSDEIEHSFCLPYPDAL